MQSAIERPDALLERQVHVGDSPLLEKTWQDAQIDYPGTKLTWALWSFPWKPAAAGEFKIAVRATDGNGALQRLESERGQFSGATGLHKVTVILVPNETAVFL